MDRVKNCKKCGRMFMVEYGYGIDETYRLIEDIENHETSYLFSYFECRNCKFVAEHLQFACYRCGESMKLGYYDDHHYYHCTGEEDEWI